MSRLTFCLLILLEVPKVILAQNEKSIERQIFMIRSKIGDNVAIQTGFKTESIWGPGLVTALHGVLQASRVTAINSESEIIYDLEIRAVDFDNDIVLLSSIDLLSIPTEIEGVEDPNIKVNQDLTAIGFI